MKQAHGAGAGAGVNTRHRVSPLCSAVVVLFGLTEIPVEE